MLERSCGALIAKTESIVMRESFRQALTRARQGSGDIQCAGEPYRLLDLLGTGELSQVYLARRVGAMPYLATVKLSSLPAAAVRYAREATVLRALHALSSLLPEVMAQGPLDGDSSRHALVLAYPNGFWGTLADLTERFPQGLDPRHAVWIWRRILDVLRFVHGHGWSHGDLRPEHALVHPGDHAVRLIGWGSAQQDPNAQGMDLVRSARTVVVLISGASGSSAIPGAVPPPLATLLTRASHDETFCRTQGAQGLDDMLRAAAHDAFGPPSFVHLQV